MSSNWHHKKPRSLGGGSGRDNRKLVNVERHHLWHQMFSNMSADEIMQDFNEYWIDPRFMIVPRTKQRTDEDVPLGFA